MNEEEEEEEEERALEDYLASLWRKIDARVCPTHNQPMTLEQVGRCVYAAPCGCRLYQGRLPSKRSKQG